MTLRPLALCICLLAVVTGPALADTRSFFGYGYTLEGGEFRYVEHHQQEVDGSGTVTDWRVDFWDADGQHIAEKTFDIGEEPAIPGYDFHMIRTGYREGIRNTGGESITLYRRKPGDASESTTTLKPRTLACADSGFDHFVREHWEALTAGERIKFQFIAAGRLDAYNFKAERIGESSFEGRPSIQVKVALDSLLGVFVDPLIVEYDQDTRQLKQYRGIGNMQRTNGKVYPVRVSYYSQPPQEAAAAVDAALAAQPAGHHDH
ncbi:MAG: hypothetical protein VX549_13610 [Pseudomonadota bacterium]|nr:hypothetical protein [Pseudomonadota bacterium]